MNILDKLNMRGEVKIDAVYDNGHTETLYEDANLIVLNGRTAIMRNLMSHESNFISHITFGEGGALKDNPAVAIPATADEKGLRQQLAYTDSQNKTYFGVTFSSRSESVPPRIVYTITIDKLSALNSKGINEMCLMLNGSDKDNAFAIKRFSTIYKSDAFGIVVTWSIFV